jgi:hypothetical protein
VPSQQIDQRGSGNGGIACRQTQRAPGAQRQKNFKNGRVEGHRTELQRPLAGLQLENSLLVRGDVGQASVLHHDALGPSG